MPSTLLSLGLPVGTLVLFLSIRGLVHLVRRSVVARVPLAPAQRVVLDAPGRYVLHFEGPAGRVVGRPSLVGPYRALGFHVVDVEVGAELPLRRAVGSRTGGSGRARVSLRSFAVERPGAIELRVSGLGSEHSRASDCALVLAHPVGARMVAWILAIVLGSLLLLLGALALFAPPGGG